MTTERDVERMVSKRMDRRAEGWNPRGEPTFPNWKTAKEGTRVRHVRSGMKGTFKRAVVKTHWSGRKKITRPLHAVIIWDNGHEGRVVAPAYDLEVISDGQS